MKKEEQGNMITEWLEKNGNPEIMKQVEKEAEELEWQHFLNSEGYHDKESNDIWKIGCSDGAIWQKSRMYSEEEVLKLLLNLPTFENNLHKDQLINRWFAENKKIKNGKL